MATSGHSFPYCFSKSAIGLATASLAHELLPLGIRVNGIAPGLFATEVYLPSCLQFYGWLTYIFPDPSSFRWLRLGLRTI